MLDPNFGNSPRADGYYYSLSFRVAKNSDLDWELERWNGEYWAFVKTFPTKKAARAYAGRIERGEV